MKRHAIRSRRAACFASVLFAACLAALPLSTMLGQRVPLRMMDSTIFVMGTSPFAPPDLSMPARGVRFADPSFHTTILRLTDRSADAYQGPGIQNEYAKADAENADGSLVVLRGNDAIWYVYDRVTCMPLRELTAFNDCVQEPEPRWDANDPQRFYYLCEMSLRAYDVARDSSWTVRDFSSDFPGAYALTTGTEGDASLFRSRWCWMVVNADYALMAVFVYDLPSDAIIGRMDAGFRDDLNWVGMSMTGNHCMFGYENLNYPDVYSADLQTSISLPAGANGHGDLAMTVGGRDVLVYQNVTTDHIAMADLESGVETALLEIPFSVNVDIGLHVSGNCAAVPGWALISTYGSKNPPPGQTHSWMDTQLFMLELADNPRVYRLAHTHAYTSLAYEDDKNYFAEAFASINSAGTRVHFGSNWGNYTPDYSEAYVVELPENWAQRLPGSTGTDLLPAPQSLEIAMYPNPCRAHSRLRITGLPDAAGDVDWRIHDMLGRSVRQGTSFRSPDGMIDDALPMQGLAPGIYVIRATVGSGILVAQRFVRLPG